MTDGSPVGSHQLPFEQGFNRRRSKSRGKLFLRLAQQAVAVDPVTHYQIVHPDLRKAEGKPQSVGLRELSGYPPCDGFK